jgi:hypothetical protein
MKTLGAGACFVILPGCAHAVNRTSLREARKKAAHRRRRIIMNNDGNDTRTAASDRPVTPENLLSKRTTGLIDSQVDSIFYCTGVFNYYFHRSEESELLDTHEGVAEYLRLLSESGTDPLEIMVDFCHRNDLEVFWSMRMNDTHDSGNPLLFCQWKKEHPEYLVGTKQVKTPYGANRWSSVDYGVPAVRDKVFRIFQDVCSRYDVDGIEMDFFRHPVLFKPQMTGDPVTQSHCDRMTGLIQRIRKMTEEIGLKRKRPVLISVRIPDSVSYCKALGIDLNEWLKKDLVDIVVGGGYFKLEPWENLVALGKQYDVPFYACLVKRRIQSSGAPEGETLPKIWRGEAYTAWKAGVDGIYTFNRFNPKDPIFRELGDPQLLKTLERIDQTAYVNEECWSRPEVWLVNGRDYVKKNTG